MKTQRETSNHNTCPIFTLWAQTNVVILGCYFYIQTIIARCPSLSCPCLSVSSQTRSGDATYQLHRFVSHTTYRLFFRALPRDTLPGSFYPLASGSCGRANPSTMIKRVSRTPCITVGAAPTHHLIPYSILSQHKEILDLYSLTPTQCLCHAI